LSATADNYELLKEVIEAFMEDFSDRYTTLLDAIQKSDAKTVTESAHALKGTSGTIGAAAVSKKASLVETLGKQGKLDELGTLPEEIGAEFERFVEVVASFEWPEC
jgi:HPt (histidine-containing phosphotransfer) domain-containing protein